MTDLALGGVTLLRYSTLGLEPRDVILLKSLIRLLSHRTEHQWVCGHDDAHLEVIGPLADPASSLPPHQAPSPIRLVMANAPPPEALHFLRLPLHVNELERMLNQLGQLIAKAPAPCSPTALNRLPTPTPAPAPVYHLRRWPQAALLTSRERLNLATLMTVRPLSLAALQESSGQTAQACESFLNDLQSAGLLQPSAAVHVKPHTSVGSLPETDHKTGQAPAAQPAPVPQGLIARIRRRLGLTLTKRL